MDAYDSPFSNLVKHNQKFSLDLKLGKGILAHELKIFKV